MKKPVLILLALVLITAGASFFFSRKNIKTQKSFSVDCQKPRIQAIPRLMLWAWERPEDLRFLDPTQAGVAYLAATLTLTGDRVAVRPRLQPLKVAQGAYVMTVVRIEVSQDDRPTLSDPQRTQVVAEILKAMKSPNVAALQIDFDARQSERGFYRALLTDVRAQLPQTMPLVMTALASWCLFDTWTDDLPVDDVVPMVFRMGKDTENVVKFLASNQGFRSQLCGCSVGIALDELRPEIPTNRRVYAFNLRSWTPQQFKFLSEKVLP